MNISSSVQLSFTKYALKGCSASIKPSVLVLHGFLGSKSNWHTFCRVLHERTQRTFFALDLRNHGRSPHAEPHDYRSMTSDVIAFVEQHRLSSVVLLGHSMGAKVSMGVALTLPTCVAGLILVDNAPVLADVDENIRTSACALLRVASAQPLDRRSATEMLKNMVPDESLRAFLLSNLVRGSDGRLHARLPLPLLIRSLPALGDFPFNGVFSGPTLFIRGRYSNYVSDARLSDVYRVFPFANIVTLDGGHWIHVEQFEHVLSSVEDFLQTN
ncbi:unnamed protein product [Pneumocystis jirovecii]|uniref:AB hydrolase-1 domain-containing protein n=2 Tax=Pneumocystis jirovecii TaxID=42068 RepID=L0PDY2_PNEJI|nr:uncharacterized protein T551_00209 [Pneumocystis jirovecii RU7]KTW32724.1 hypothetical protein T551_00209 [Pneumocystis jirovecii RU7]CCJ30412.1 unnamed protein product [Pneumocystis jirovecii]